MRKILISLVGPSGSGKSTVEQELVKKGFRKIISHTSRAMRKGEEDNVDYHFADRMFFEKEKDNFIEFVEFAGNFYGAHKDSIESYFSVIVVEPNGAKQIRKYCEENDIQNILVSLTISEDKQIQRMIERGDSEESVRSRLQKESIRQEVGLLDIDQVYCSECLFLTPENIAELIIQNI